jgi:hypothetical protein
VKIKILTAWQNNLLMFITIRYKDKYQKIENL